MRQRAAPDRWSGRHGYPSGKLYAKPQGIPWGAVAATIAGLIAGTSTPAFAQSSAGAPKEAARKLVPTPQFGYIRSGSGDEWTLRENVRAFDDRQILPRHMAGVREPYTSTSLLGIKVGTPIFVPSPAECR